MTSVLNDNILGIYLFDSLTYGDFQEKRSDIDLCVITNNLLLRRHGEQIKNILPPKQPRPYYGGGVFYCNAPYGNEWSINNYLMYNNGITLFDKDIKTLIKPIKKEDVRYACIKDLFAELEPKTKDVIAFVTFVIGEVSKVSDKKQRV